LLIPIIKFMGMFNFSFLKNNQRGFWITINTVVIYLVYPYITDYAFGAFYCVEVEGVSYLTRDIGIECWGEEHIKIILAFILPAILVWIIGFPLLVYIILKR